MASMDQPHDPSATASRAHSTTSGSVPSVPSGATDSPGGTGGPVGVDARYYDAPHPPHPYAVSPYQQHQQQSHLAYAYPPNAPPYGRYEAAGPSGAYGTSSLPVKLELGDRNSSSPSSQPGGGTGVVMRRIGGKANVSSACAPCKKAHLACDVSRPCKRCVNMGKEALCADVPVSHIPFHVSSCCNFTTLVTSVTKSDANGQHKKRGRPKSLKPPLSEPYSRARAGFDMGMRGWRSEGMPYGGEAYPYPYSADPPIHPGGGGYPLSRSLTDGDPAMWAGPSPAPFAVFTTTDWRVLRVSPACYTMLGYHPHDFVNLSLLDWFMPVDRPAIDDDRQRLITLSPYSAPLKSDRDALAPITQYGERDLLSPAEGMREPYPNQNVRVLRSDGHHSLFNVRLHLGGGLGGSLYRPETTGRIYLVVSLLLISDHLDRAPRASTGAVDDRRYGPPTPITAMPGASPVVPSMPQSASAPSLHAASNSGSGLPSFSSMAAAAEGPPAGSRYEPSPLSAGPGQAYFPSAPRAPPATGPYDYVDASGNPTPYQRSPSPRYSAPPPIPRSVTGPPAGMSINTHYPAVAGGAEYGTPSTGSPFFHPRVTPTQVQGQGSGEWDRRIVSQPNVSSTTPIQATHSPVTATAISPVAPVQTPTTATLPHPQMGTPQDYGRRTWEL